MPINPNIAMAFRPAVELQQTDPLRDYAALAQIQQSQVQNQLARQQLEQKQGALNYLRGNPDLSTPEGLKGLRQFGDVGLSYEKLVTDQATNALKRQELEGKLRDQRMTALGTGLTSVMNDPSDEKLMSAFDNLEATGVKVGDLRTRLLGMPLDQRMAEIKQYVTTHPEGRQALAFVQPKPEKADLNGQTVWLDTNPNSLTYLKPLKTLEDQPLPAPVEAQKVRIAGAGASRTQMNVNTQLPASEEAQKEFMKSSRVTYDTLKTAPALINNIEESKKLIAGAKSFMGPGGEPLLKTASFLNNRFGTNIDTKGVTDASELRSRLFTGVIENLRKLDAQPTAGQQQALQDAIGNLGTDPTALPRILDSVVDTLRQKVEGYNEEVSNAESRGVKFPYKPQIKLPTPKVSTVEQIPGQNAAPTGRTVTRTGKLNGRRVVQYNDGSVEYGD